MYPAYGGYWGYRAAPLDDVIRKSLVVLARKQVERQQHEEMEDQLAERRREMENRRY